eukprot:scaffold64586_cov50-Attheya_sp.AAC.2
MERVTTSSEKRVSLTCNDDVSYTAVSHFFDTRNSQQRESCVASHSIRSIPTNHQTIPSHSMRAISERLRQPLATNHRWALDTSFCMIPF